MLNEFDLMSSTKVLSTAQLKDRERVRRASGRGLVVGAKTPNESLVLDVLRKEGPQDNVAAIVEATGLSATVVSGVISDLVARNQVLRTNDGLYGEKARISAA